MGSFLLFFFFIHHLQTPWVGNGLIQLTLELIYYVYFGVQNIIYTRRTSFAVLKLQHQSHLQYPPRLLLSSFFLELMEHLYPRCRKQIVSPISKILLLKSWHILRSILSITIIQHLYIVLVTLHETTRRRRKEGGNTHIRSDQHLTFTHFMLVPRSILFQSHFNHNGRPMGHKRECRTEGMNKQKR